MKRAELLFERPRALQADGPPERRGLARDEVRLLVTTERGHEHARFRDLPRFLTPGTLLVVNTSATLPASLPARHAALGPFLANVSTDYGHGLSLIEPRKSAAEPGPLPLEVGDLLEIGDLPARLVAPHPGLPRLWFVQVEGDLRRAMEWAGTPIRYGYLEPPYPPLADYQTFFSEVPGSAEMPSAARPFTARVVDALQAKGISLAGITLHSGVSSHELEADEVEEHVLYAEPFAVPERTAEAVTAARREGRPVIAVGTTVVRALESAWDGERVRPAAGFTRLLIHPGRPVKSVDGLVTGLHDPLASHLALLYALAPQELVRAGYEEAVREGYLWHEFGDSHLLMPGR
ncbi:MAG TPA: S-adenosylmethionine:tRNA ribosyltransferase-isomerase [Thermoanaerobaculia bacterium]|nr:S-adenosylmethionine:tRNA ribosyltransferase-isomerase [Thermoanaerobaculia bacterium]